MAKGKKIVEVVLATALFAGCAGGVMAADAAASVAARKAAMKQVAIASAKLRNPNISAADARAAGKTIDEQTKVFAANLAKGTGAESGQTTKAKAEIWSDAKGFKAELDKSHAANAALVKVGDDPAAVKAAAKAVTDTCNSCHTKFRAQ